MKFGDKYAIALSEGLKKIPQINQFHLSGNRITKVGSTDLIKTISRNARILELASNAVGKIGIEHLSDALIQPKCR